VLHQDSGTAPVPNDIVPDESRIDVIGPIVPYRLNGEHPMKFMVLIYSDDPCLKS
jgi:hypothetical protein